MQEQNQSAAGSPQQALEQIVAAAVEPEGFVVEKAVVVGAADVPTVQVTLDRAHGAEGVDMDAVARLSRLVSAALDDHGESVPGVGTGEYLLEVSSAGVDRPLTERRHWARNVGRLVEVSVDGAAPITARVLEVGADGVELAEHRPGAKKGMPAKTLAPVRVPFAQLGTGAVQVEWGGSQQSTGAARDGKGPADTTEA
ncbi:ribosome maturation factor RimP [Micrococcus lylae]|uniref:Ribosome maturation factor RimP n=1 Tax=Micrococcus lylae TaxID=1273 RepID=A0A1R4IPJ6_9MICC|nr:ribosome assembly cofactor RimP [Micrococcus lylae]SJN21143.1 clustered with transcription termination protein NusA [Micrococcus lylae]